MRHKLNRKNHSRRKKKSSSKRIHKHVACGFNMIFTPRAAEKSEKRSSSERQARQVARGGGRNNKTWFCDMKKETRSQSTTLETRARITAVVFRDLMPARRLHKAAQGRSWKLLVVAIESADCRLTELPQRKLSGLQLLNPSSSKSSAKSGISKLRRIAELSQWQAAGSIPKIYYGRLR
jgi:hypothetical protein